MNHSDSGLAHGTSGSPQTTLENNEMAAAAAAARKRVETDFYGTNKAGALLPAQYSHWIGTNQRPRLLGVAHNSSLRNAIDQLYRPGAFIGDGGTASVIRFERATGLAVGRNGGTHLQKGQDMLKYLQNKVLTQNLSRTDRRLATRLARDLRNAIGGK